MDLSAMNQALTSLCEKYGVVRRGILEATTGAQAGGGVQLRTNDGVIPLLPWRVTRRFMELRTLAAGPTLERVSTLRFMYAAANHNMESLLYREFDLCEWIGGEQMHSVFLVANGQAAANAIVRLGNGISCSVECSRCLTKESAPIDRHEIIAGRGIASDRVVDTQVPQSSIYVYAENNNQQFTDEDAELFGMDMDIVFLVRAAFAALRDSRIAQEWATQHARLLRLVHAAMKSAETRQLQKTKEICS